MILCGAGNAGARRQSSPFEISLAPDLTLLGSGLLFWITAGAVSSGSPVRGACDPCDRSGLNALDRPVVGFRSAVADRASDVMVAAIPALALGGSFLDWPAWGWRGLGEDLVLIAQAMAATGALQQLTSLAVRRPRPLMYRPGAEEGRETLWARTSFFSGHSADAFAVAASFATIFSLRRPRSDLRPLVWVVSLLAASVVPLCRVASGEHFWSDVLVGAAVGTSVGILIPVLHRRQAQARHGLQLAGLGVAGQF